MEPDKNMYLALYLDCTLLSNKGNKLIIKLPNPNHVLSTYLGLKLLLRSYTMKCIGRLPIIYGFHLIVHSDHSRRVFAVNSISGSTFRTCCS